MEILDILSLLSAVVGLVLYILNGIALFTICKNKQIEKGWLSFVPIANVYVLGKLADLYIPKSGQQYKYAKPLTVLYIVEIFLSAVFAILAANSVISILENILNAIEKDTALTNDMFISVIPLAVVFVFLFAVAVIYKVFYSIALWRVYALICRKNAVLFLILSVLFSFLAPVFLFLIRNQKTDDQNTPQFELLS